MAKPLVRIKSKLGIISGRPDLTPLVDVLFLLLIFFMLSSSFVQVSGIKVDLPSTTQSPNQRVVKFVVTIDDKNNFYFNDQPMEWALLKERLVELSAKRSAEQTVTTIIIRADKNAPFGVVAKLMGMAEKIKLNAVVATISSPAEGDVEIFEDAER